MTHLFPSTLPVGAPELMRVSDFRRYLQEQQALIEQQLTGYDGPSLS